MKKYSAEELFKIAYAHLQKKDFRKSSGLFEKLINDYPENLSVLRNLTHCYIYLGEFEKAETTIKKIDSTTRIEITRIVPNKRAFSSPTLT